MMFYCTLLGKLSPSEACPSPHGGHPPWYSHAAQDPGYAAQSLYHDDLGIVQPHPVPPFALAIFQQMQHVPIILLDICEETEQPPPCQWLWQ